MSDAKGCDKHRAIIHINGVSFQGTFTMQLLPPVIKKSAKGLSITHKLEGTLHSVGVVSPPVARRRAALRHYPDIARN